MIRFFARHDMAEGFAFLSAHEAEKAGVSLSCYENHREKILRVCYTHGFDFSWLEYAPQINEGNYFFGRIDCNKGREVFKPLYIAVIDFRYHPLDKVSKIAIFEVGNNEPLKIARY